MMRWATSGPRALSLAHVGYTVKHMLMMIMMMMIMIILILMMVIMMMVIIDNKSY